MPATDPGASLIGQPLMRLWALELGDFNMDLSFALQTKTTAVSILAMYSAAAFTTAGYGTGYAIGSESTRYTTVFFGSASRSIGSRSSAWSTESVSVRSAGQIAIASPAKEAYASAFYSTVAIFVYKATLISFAPGSYGDETTVSTSRGNSPWNIFSWFKVSN